MNAKEKAIELVLKYLRLQDVGYDWFNKPLAKKCAIIGVDEIIKNGCFSSQPQIEKSNKIKPNSQYKEYWEEVKKEIELI